MRQDSNNKVGFIGLGNMGRPMVRRLIDAGYSLLVHDVVQSSAADLLEKGACWVATPKELARRCQVICTSLPGPSEAEEVFLGENGIGRGIQKGAVCIDFTTNAPMLVKRIHDELVKSEADLLDVPVSGGVEGASAGTLTMLAGGSEWSLEEVRPLLEILGSKILHVGEIGSASICKVLHNCAVFCANLATMECLTTGVKAGVDAKTLIEVFQQSGLGKNLDLQRALPKSLFQGNFQARFAMATALKDMKLATELAGECQVPMQLAELCQQDMEEAIQRGWGQEDNSKFLTLQEARAGVEVRVE